MMTCAVGRSLPERAYEVVFSNQSMISKIESRPPVVLSIAGYDPSSGAGVTADIKTVAAHRCYAITCITALTVQSTQGVKRIEPVDARTFSEMLEELAMDFKIDAVHIGMLGSAEIVRATAAFIERRHLNNIVLDPVLRSSSGAELLSRDGLEAMRQKLFPLTFAITPNIDEAAALTGLPVRDVDEMWVAAGKLQRMGASNVIVTGGHLDPPVELLSLAGGKKTEIFKGTKIAGHSTHGTGCAFATSLACNLALGRNLIHATKAAKQYVEHALRNAVPLGKGRGPVNHLAALG
jgi:hydroxymethylpyrimidine/phosphomethylpyrimidine kinase